MDQHAGDFDHGDPVDHGVGRVTMLSQARRQTTGQDAGAGGQGGGARCIQRFMVGHLDLVPENTRPKAG